MSDYSRTMEMMFSPDLNQTELHLHIHDVLDDFNRSGIFRLEMHAAITSDDWQYRATQAILILTGEFGFVDVPRSISILEEVLSCQPESVIIKYHLAIALILQYLSSGSPQTVAGFKMRDRAIDFIVDISPVSTAAKCFLVSHYFNNNNRFMAEDIYRSIEIHRYNDSTDELIKRVIFYCDILLNGFDHSKIIPLTKLLRSPVALADNHRILISMAGIRYCRQILTDPQISWLNKTSLSWSSYEFITIINNSKNASSRSTIHHNNYDDNEKRVISETMNQVRFYLGLSAVIVTVPTLCLGLYLFKRFS